MQTSLFFDNPIFYRFFRDSPVGIVITTVTDGRYAAVNPAFAHMLGYTPDELIGQPFQVMGMSDGEVRAMVLKMLRDIRRLGDVPLMLQTRDGRSITCVASVHLENFNDESYLFCIIQDLTEHEQAQEALRQSEARFRLFFRSIPMPLLVFDEDSFQIVDVNTAACRLYGYSYDEFTALSLRDLMPEADWDDVANSQRGADNPDVEPLRIRRQVLKSGEIIQVESISYSFILDGQRINLMAVQNVTEQLADQSTLRASQERLQLIANVTTDAIWTRDTSSDQINWSSGLSSLFGYRDDIDPTHSWWVERVHPDDREAIEASIKAAFAGDSDEWKGEYRFLRADGTYTDVLDRGIITRDENGRPVRFFGAMVDMTGQMHMAEVAGRAAMEERQRLARDLHESVTQSLYSLSLLAEAAKRRAADGDDRMTVEYIGRLGDLSRQGLKQLRLLVYELRPSQLEQVGLEAALRHRLEAVEHRAGIRFHLEDKSQSPLPLAFSGELFRLAQEALNYSLKFASAKAVFVRLWAENGHFNLEIRDDGIWGDPSLSGGNNELMSIRNLAESLGGVLDVDITGEGMTLHTRLPVDIALSTTAG